MSQSPRILLGLISAHHPSRWAYRDRARREYLKDSPLDYLFVMGHTPCADWPYKWEKDELAADCSDAREYMVLKNKALFQYALAGGYDYCFRACDDTWIFSDRIQKAGLEPYDYAGNCPCKFNINGVEKVWMPFYDFFHGGCGVWLSRKAMEILVADEWKGSETHFPPFVECPPPISLRIPLHPIWWDDLWIGETLKGHLPLDHPLRYQPHLSYAARGLRVFEDSGLFLNDNHLDPISVHDPGVGKLSGEMWDDLKAQIREMNSWAVMGAEQAAEVTK